MSSPRDVNLNTAISNSEVVYRRILPSLTKLVDGRRRPSSNAFSDRDLRPSVDRVLILHLQNLNAEFTRQAPENGVAKISAAQIRGVDLKKPYVADVHAEPLEGNEAHCTVRLGPTEDAKSVFKKLIERLALLSQWELELSE